MQKWYVKADFAGAGVREPECIEEHEIWATFEMDSRPFTVVWMESKEEAELWYQNCQEEFSRIRQLNQVRRDIEEARIEGDEYRMQALIEEEKELEGV